MATDDEFEKMTDQGFTHMEKTMGPEQYQNLLAFQKANLAVTNANEEQIRASTKAIEANIEISKAHAKKTDRLANFIGGYTTLAAPFFVVACAGGCWGIWDWALG